MLGIFKGTNLIIVGKWLEDRPKYVIGKLTVGKNLPIIWYKPDK